MLKYFILLLILSLSLFAHSQDLITLERLSDTSVRICGTGSPVDITGTRGWTIPSSSMFSTSPSSFPTPTVSDNTLSINNNPINDIRFSMSDFLFGASSVQMSPVTVEGCATLSWPDGIVSEIGSVIEVGSFDPSMFPQPVIQQITVSDIIVVSPIPTLSEWGLTLLSLILMIFGVNFLRIRNLSPIEA